VYSPSPSSLARALPPPPPKRQRMGSPPPPTQRAREKLKQIGPKGILKKGVSWADKQVEPFAAART
jgi:hypothetical protein